MPRRLVWPASAMLTNSGVALILRILGTEHGDWWSTAAGTGSRCYDAAGAEVGRVTSTCEEIVFAFVPSDAGRWLLVDAGTFVNELPAPGTRACLSA